MAVAVAALISPQEYLERERKSPTKHEYIVGRMVEMAGASKEHNLITSSLTETLHLPSIDCNLPLADVYDKVEIAASPQSRRVNGHQG